MLAEATIKAANAVALYWGIMMAIKQNKCFPIRRGEETRKVHRLFFTPESLTLLPRLNSAHLMSVLASIIRSGSRR